MSKKSATPPEPKKKKYKSSRAGRTEEACDHIRDAAQPFRDASAALDTYMEQLKEPGDSITIPADVFKDLISDVDDLKSPLEELKEEMENWYGNLPDSLQGSDKGERINEAATTLESACDELDGVEFPDIPGDAQEMFADELEELKEALENVADNLESAADTAEGTDFPGMYG